MTPSTILSAVRMGQSAFNERHKALDLLWRQFGSAIRSERIKRGWTPRVFARKLNRTAAMLGMMETGKRRWPMDLAEKACRLLKKPEQWPDAGKMRR